MHASLPGAWTRRRFLLTAALGGVLPRRLRAGRGHLVAREPWANVERVAEGVWAIVSTPLEDRTTLCNGGIVAGRTGVLLIEAFASDDGARWACAQAEQLVGRPVTHVLLTHYHSDHTTGLRGAAERGRTVLATAVTRDLVEERGRDAPLEILGAARVIDGRRPSELDLGGRSVLIVPRRGHTDSDVSVEITDPPVIFCGDLYWNAMFPNYVDALPSRLSEEVGLLRRLDAETYVPGHGPVGDAAALGVYAEVLDSVESAARDAVARGWSAEEAASRYTVPTRLGEWTLFSPQYFARAIGRWIDELRAGGGGSRRG